MSQQSHCSIQYILQLFYAGALYIIYITNEARSAELIMIISYPASPSRIIVSLKTIRHITDNLTKKVKEMNTALEETEREKSISIKCYKQKGARKPFEVLQRF